MVQFTITPEQREQDYQDLLEFLKTNGYNNTPYANLHNIFPFAQESKYVGIYQDSTSAKQYPLIDNETRDLEFSKEGTSETIASELNKLVITQTSPVNNSNIQATTIRKPSRKEQLKTLIENSHAVDKELLLQLINYLTYTPIETTNNLNSVPAFARADRLSTAWYALSALLARTREEGLLAPYSPYLNYSNTAIVSSGSKQYKSLVANNYGNAVTDTTKWKEITFGTLDDADFVHCSIVGSVNNTTKTITLSGSTDDITSYLNNLTLEDIKKTGFYISFTWNGSGNVSLNNNEYYTLVINSSVSINLYFWTNDSTNNKYCSANRIQNGALCTCFYNNVATNGLCIKELWNTAYDEKAQMDTWSSDKYYQSNQTAVHNNIVYTSKSNANINHNPQSDTSESYWKRGISLDDLDSIRYNFFDVSVSGTTITLTTNSRFSNFAVRSGDFIKNFSIGFICPSNVPVYSSLSYGWTLVIDGVSKRLYQATKSSLPSYSKLRAGYKIDCYYDGSDFITQSEYTEMGVPPKKRPSFKAEATSSSQVYNMPLQALTPEATVWQATATSNDIQMGDELTILCGYSNGSNTWPATYNYNTSPNSCCFKLQLNSNVTFSLFMCTLQFTSAAQGGAAPSQLNWYSQTIDIVFPHNTTSASGYPHPCYRKDFYGKNYILREGSNYIVYSNGYCLQWGTLDKNASEGLSDWLSLPIPYTEDKYAITTTALSRGWTDSYTAEDGGNFIRGAEKTGFWLAVRMSKAKHCGAWMTMGPVDLSSI